MNPGIKLSLEKVLLTWPVKQTGQYYVGIRIGYSAIANQLLELMRQLLQHPQLQVVALATHAEYMQHQVLKDPLINQP